MSVDGTRDSGGTEIVVVMALAELMHVVIEGVGAKWWHCLQCLQCL